MQKLALMTILVLFVTSCAAVTPAPSDPLCAGTRAQRAKVAADVAATADDRLALSAGGLVVLIDAGCAK